LVAASPIPPARPSGGSITVTGADIVLAGAELDASGPSGGGDIRVGGDLRGAGDLPRARTLAVDANTVIRADALEAGDGGTVVLWSEDHTVFRGAISSRGGPEGGDGGFVEVSGKARLSFSGLVDRRAPMGRAGTLLLDPYDIVITDIAPSDGGFDGEYFPDGTPSNIFVGDLVENLQFGDTMISTGSSDDEVPGEGSISVLTPVNWGTSSDLRLSAVGNVNLQQAITAPNGGFSIDAGGTITTGPDGAVSVNRFRLDAGSWEQVGPNLPAFSAVDFSVDPFNASFLRARGGSGTAGSPWLLTDAYGLQGVGSLLGGNFALANDIVLAPAASWNQGEGFRPIGADFGEGFDAFSGTFDGSGFAVDALTIDVTETSAVGLFGVNAGEIRDLRLLGVSVNASFASYLGGLVGLNLGGGSITNVEVEGSATGSGVAALGGLVGRNLGTVDLSRAFVTVEAAGFSGSSLRAGGLVGVNVSADTVSRSHASGTIVIGDAEDVSVGGLVGDNAGAIYESRADVDISTSGIVSFIEAGGLVGTNDGTIDTAAATGRVNVAASADAIAGGLVGWNDGSIARAYATGDVFGASPSGIADVGGLVGVNGGTITQALAVGAVGGSAAEVLGTGGLVAFSSSNNGSAGVVTDSFWNVEATGQTTSIGGGTGLTTDELQDFAGFMAIAGVANWSFTQDWSPPRAPAGAGSGQYARLYAVDPVVWVVPADDFAVEYGIPFATFRDSIPYALYGGPGIYVFGPEIGNPNAFATEVTIAPPQGIAPLGRIDAGRYDIEIAGVRSVTPDADTAQDYAFVASPAAFDVLPLNLTIRALDQSKPFGTTAALGTTAFTALLNGSALLPYDDAVTGVTLSSPGAPPTAPEGPYPLTPSDAQGVGLAGNYFISYVPGTLVVLPAADVSPPGQTAATITPPSFVPTVPNAQGTFVNFGPSDHSTAPTPVAGARSQAAADAQQVLAQMEAMAQELELAAQACRQQTPLGTELLDCIANALGSYANALEDIALDLPPELAQVSAIIRQAQEGVQGVRTRAEARLAAATTDAERRAIERQAVDEAVGVVQGAAVEVRRAIELIRADDPQLVRIFSDQGTTVVRALERVEIELVRAIGI
jgi:hypothetical protein